VKSRRLAPWERPPVADGPRLVGGSDTPLGTPSRAHPRGPAVGELPFIADGSNKKEIPAPPIGRAITSKWIFSRRVLGSTGIIVAGVGIGLFSIANWHRGPNTFNIEDAARSVVMIEALECDWTGSGTLVAENGLILTNSHVATDQGNDVCQPLVGITNSYDEEPSDWYHAVVLVDDPILDLAVIQMVTDMGVAVHVTNQDPIPLSTATPLLGDQIETLGYPGVGGSTLTFTSGDFAGLTQVDSIDFYKTTASLNPGVSGGSALNGSFALIGVPTALFGSEVICEGEDCASFGNSIGLIRPIRYAVPLIERAKVLALD